MACHCASGIWEPSLSGSVDGTGVELGLLSRPLVDCRLAAIAAVVQIVNGAGSQAAHEAIAKSQVREDATRPRAKTNPCS